MIKFSCTEDEYQEHVSNDDGVCLNCASIREGDTEPDAENYPCDECGENKVMGFEQAFIAGYVEITEEE